MTSLNMATGGFETAGDECSECPMAHYLLVIDGFLDTRRFEAMPRDGAKLTVFDTRNKKERNAAVGACIRQWRHCWRRGVSNGRCVKGDID